MTTLGSDPGSAGKTGLRQAELVHEARKAIKRMRAFARLQRFEVGEWEFDRVNSSLRATGRRLAQARDAEMRLMTLERLQERHPASLHNEDVKRLSECLRHERDRVSQPTRERAVLEELGEMRRELHRWKLAEHDFDALEQGLRRIYREGRQRFKRLGSQMPDDVDALHDWRKRVKSLYYALDMLGGSTAKGARASTRRAERLGDLLGAEHDLWMLIAYVHQHQHLFDENNAAQSTLVSLAEKRRERLRDRALSQGARLYRRKPGAFAKRMRKALTRS